MKRMKRLMGMLIAVMSLCIGLSVVAYAAPKVKIIPKTLWAGCEYSFGVSFENMSEKAKLVSIKSSKPNVIRATKEGTEIYATNLMPIKPGKSKITVKYKVGKKTYQVSATYTVKSYPSPYQYIKVNGKNINIKKNKYFYDVVNYKKTKAKIQIKLKKGWKIVDAYGYDQNGSGFFTPKNGKNFNIKKGKDAYVFFTIANGKGDELQYGIRFYR